MSSFELDFLVIHWDASGCWTERTGSGIADARRFLNDGRFREMSSGSDGRSAFAVLSPSEALEMVRRYHSSEEQLPSHLAEEASASMRRVESTLQEGTLVIARVSEY
jgi:hypothetical protein